MLAVIDSPNGLTVFVGGEPITIGVNDIRYSDIVEIWESKLTDAEKEEAIKTLTEQSITDLLPDGFYFDGDDLYYNGIKLHNALRDKAMSLYQSGHTDFGPLEKFVENLFQNPSEVAINELYDFLSYKQLPITPDGYFIAYKGITDNGWSVSGNTETKVLQGKVDERGRIFNDVGLTIEVDRESVDPIRSRHCSHGLHVGAFDYANSFGSRLLIAKVNPKDVVSIPNDCNCQKARVCKYEVVALGERELSSPVVKQSDDNSILEIGGREDYIGEEFLARLKKYLENKTEEWECIDLKMIRNAMSPEYPTPTKVFRALDSLGYDYDVDSDSPNKSIVYLD